MYEPRISTEPLSVSQSFIVISDRFILVMCEFLTSLNIIYAVLSYGIKWLV